MDDHDSILEFVQEYDDQNVGFYIGDPGCPLPKIEQQQPSIDNTSDHPNIEGHDDSPIPAELAEKLSKETERFFTGSVVDVKTENFTTSNGKVCVNILCTKDDIMEMFNKQEQLFKEQVLNAPPPVVIRKRARSPTVSSSPQRNSDEPGAGLDHLENLVRLMEQMSHLKEENSGLRRKCMYLEDTKSLLSIQNQMLRTSPTRKSRGIHAIKSSLKNRHKKQKEGCPSDSSDIETSGSSEPKLKMMKLQQRSQSVGSINAQELVDIDLGIGSGKSGDKIKDSRKFDLTFSKSKISSKKKKVPTATLR